MPTNLPWSGATVPISDEGDDVPGNMLQYATDINPLLVLQAADQADRDANFSTVPSGTLVSCAALNILWQKISGGWKTYGYQTAWAAPGVTWAAGWSDAGSSYSIDGRWADVYIMASKATDIVMGANAGLADDTVCTLPVGLRPHQNLSTVWDGPGGSPGSTSGTAMINSAGVVVLRDGLPSWTVPAGSALWIHASFLVS